MSDLSTIWKFVEQYYPNYSSCSDIMRNDDLCKIVNGELNGSAEIMFKNEFGSDLSEATAAFNHSSRLIYEKAIQGFIDGQNQTFGNEWSLTDIVERANEKYEIELSNEDAVVIKNSICQTHDATIGINWDVIDNHILDFKENNELLDNAFEWQEIKFEGKVYNCRVIDDMEHIIGSLLVAPEELEMALTATFRDNKNHSDYRLIHEQICYYATPEEMKLSDIDLYNLIYN